MMHLIPEGGGQGRQRGVGQAASRGQPEDAGKSRGAAHLWAHPRWLLLSPPSSGSCKLLNLLHRDLGREGQWEGSSPSSPLGDVLTRILCSRE